MVRLIEHFRSIFILDPLDFKPFFVSRIHASISRISQQDSPYSFLGF